MPSIPVVIASKQVFYDFANHTPTFGALTVVEQKQQQPFSLSLINSAGNYQSDFRIHNDSALRQS